MIRFHLVTAFIFFFTAIPSADAGQPQPLCTGKNVDNMISSPSPSYSWGISPDRRGRLLAFGFVGKEWVVRRGDRNRQAWETIDHFTPEGYKRALCFDGAVDHRNWIYASGIAQDAQDRWHWLARRSRDDGKTWETVDHMPIPTGFIPTVRRVIVDAHDRIFIVGATESLDQKNFDNFWIVRRSVDHGKTWATVDTFHPGYASSIAVDPHGRIYVSGSGGGLDDNFLLVKSSDDGGNTWNTAFKDDPAQSRLKWTFSTTVMADRRGGVFAAGSFGDEKGRGAYFIRSRDRGKTWGDRTYFKIKGGEDTVYYQLRTDIRDDLYIVGKGADQTGILQWFLLKSHDQGTSWKTLDSYSGALGFGAWPTDLFVGFDGKITLSGLAFLSDKTSYRWLVREVSCRSSRGNP